MDDEDKANEIEIARLEEEGKNYPPLDELETEWRQLRSEIHFLKQIMNIADDDPEYILTDIESEEEVKEWYHNEMMEENNDEECTSSDGNDGNNRT